MKQTCLLLTLVTFSFFVSCLGATATELGIKDSRFTVNGKTTFLLGISYYGACGAPMTFITKDFDDFKRHGCNWVRIWATWNAFHNDVSAVDQHGNIRRRYMDKLKQIIHEAGKRGMIVDVTVSRGRGLLPDHKAHMKAIRALAQELRPYRNVYFDLANERNVRDSRYVSFQELRELRDAVKKIDPQRLVTASHGGDISREELEKYVRIARVDFISPHRPRNPRSPHETQSRTLQYRAWLRALGHTMPVHYQEPFRRDYGRWQPEAKDFLVDLAGAALGGAAGWCLHNGAVRKKSRPRRCFDMREKEGRLVDQFDKTEREVFETMAEILAKPRKVPVKR